MIKKKQVGNIKPVLRMWLTTQEPRTTLLNQIHSQSPMWSYHSNWSNDLSPPHAIPPSPLNSYYSQLWLGNLGTASSINAQS